MSNYLKYELRQGEFLNRFLWAGTFSKPEEFTKGVLQGKVNEWLKKGFSIHENPCRKEFIAHSLANRPQLPQLGTVQAGTKVEEFGEEKQFCVYFPFGNLSVDNSAFYFNPTYLKSYAYTQLVSPVAQQTEFELTTCGGARVWVNQQLVCDFAPFTRNLRKVWRFQLPLGAGCNQIMVCLDDLAERDTDYYFRLQMLQGETVEVHLPVAEGVHTQRVFAVEQMLEQARFEKEVYSDEPIELVFDEPLPFDCQLNYSYTPGVATRLHKREALTGHGVQQMKAGKSKVVLERLAPLPEFYFFHLEISVDGIAVGCKIGAQVFAKELLTPAPKELQKRKQTALRYLAQTGVDSAYRAAALYALGEDLPLAESIIQDDLEGIALRKDCSDFYFSVILYLYQQHGQQMSHQLRQQIKKVALEFRYWIDEPGNDVMWFFSENHALLFHICQLLAGRLFPDEIFTNSGNDSRSMVKKAEALLDSWFEEFFAEFMTEWNSSAYIPVDMVGLGVLYEAEPEGSALKAKAKKALDMIARCLAINGHNGANMATFGRSYEEQIKGNYTSGTTSLLYLLYGKGFLNRVGMGYCMLALGSYAPPEEYSRYLTLAPAEKLTFRNTQGFEGHVNTCLYKTNEVVLSTAVGFKPFEEGYQEHILQAAITPLAQVFINHPGEVQPYGSGRPSFWAGNGTLPLAVQHKGTGVLVYCIAENHLVDYTHAYFPVAEFSEVAFGGNWIAGRQNNGYIGLVAQNGLHLSDKGKFAGRQLISPGKNNIWIVETAQRDEFATVEDFAQYLQGIIVAENAGLVTIGNTRYGTMMLEYNGALLVDGKRQGEYPLTAEGILEIEK